jgi:hypothetical protein
MVFVDDFYMDRPHLFNLPRRLLLVSQSEMEQEGLGSRFGVRVKGQSKRT